MKQRPEHLQPGLFDAITPGVVLRPEQTDELATLLAALFAEIAVALANGDFDND